LKSCGINFVAPLYICVITIALKEDFCKCLVLPLQQYIFIFGAVHYFLRMCYCVKMQWEKEAALEMILSLQKQVANLTE